MRSGWRIWIDRGGTFTDVVGISPAGETRVAKVLSVQPGSSDDPAAAAIAAMVGQQRGQPLPAGLIQDLRLGTTVATNALLEGRGAPVLLVVNQGFADLLTMGDLRRPDLFALAVQRPDGLKLRVIEVDGRLAADGRELEPLVLDASFIRQLHQARAEGYRSCAIALLHSYRNPSHEQQVAAALVDIGLDVICPSHQLSRLPGLVPRGQTALVEAAVAPVLGAYLDQVEQALAGVVPLRVMRSSGALAARPLLHAKDTILSGPAGGMVGALAVARQALRLAGLPPQPVVGFDMGGTSTDVFHCAGDLHCQRLAETTIAGLELQAPMLPIHTVAAGGGSIVRVDGERLQVGPQSAGANPGPVAYGRGGPLTVTDANLLLGRLPVQALPQVFGASGDQAADLQLVQRAFADLAATMRPLRPGLTAEQVAAGALQIAIETMAAAVRRISLERGDDVREALLVSYGAAAAQHACRLAAELGIRRVLIDPMAGVLSAYGIGMAPQSVLLERSLRQPLDAAALIMLHQQIEDLHHQAAAQLAQVVDLSTEVLQPIVQVELRHRAQERGFVLPWCAPEAGVDGLRQAFAARHQQCYGYFGAVEDLVIERVLLELQAPVADWTETVDRVEALNPSSLSREPSQEATATTPLWLDAQSGWQRVPLWQRRQLRPQQRLQGPAVVLDQTTTVVLEPLWQLQVLGNGALLLEPLGSAPAAPPPSRATADLDGPRLDPVLLELYQHRFQTIAQHMGLQLQQSARSLNIRERCDFSCALFDPHGALVANAPHIPVHLGSMGDSVVSLLQAVSRGDRQPLGPGDVVLANNPYNGGTHLPDITAITPVFAPGAQPGEAALFFVASRGHHADVGGITPGSMPATSRCIDDEGLLLDNVPFLINGNLDEPLWRQRFAALAQPVRNPDMLLADLQAQVAANRCGVEAVLALIERHGIEQVNAYMGHVQANAAAAVRRLIARLEGGEATVDLDHGAQIRVAARVDRDHQRLCLDFSGTSRQHEGNLNAPLAVTRAVVLYVLRLLVAEPIPLNAGCFAPLELIVPTGTLLNPLPPAAVVAGNVEISQATANALLLALGMQAASQGTMNNLSFGHASCQYYETIGGGCGAGPGYRGGSALQSHMTNSRLTDPEVLEERLPVRLERMAIRRGSGGRGRWSGGDGVIRQLRFLQPVNVSLISGSRLVAPPGLAGGEPGACGRNTLLDAAGQEHQLPGCCELALERGDGLRIETPGGGGYGRPDDLSSDQTPEL